MWYLFLEIKLEQVVTLRIIIDMHSIVDDFQNNYIDEKKLDLQPHLPPQRHTL